MGISDGERYDIGALLEITVRGRVVRTRCTVAEIPTPRDDSVIAVVRCRAIFGVIGKQSLNRVLSNYPGWESAIAEFPGLLLIHNLSCVF